ncbi:MAG: GNAT family N-acetyltransferase [Chloroflexi bacterium]|nr:GNAT family N-acetyltransferase [Chloroflexota bacterium]
MSQQISIRPATESDTLAIVKVNIDTRRATHGGFYPAQLLARMSYEAKEKAWRQALWKNPESPNNIVLVAETDDKKIVGILVGGPERSHDDEYKGEIYILYVLPDYHKQYIGKQLVVSAVKKLLEINISNLLIWVIADNPSRFFYESIGGKPVREKEVEIGEIKMKEIGYGWKDIRSAFL